MAMTIAMARHVLVYMHAEERRKREVACDVREWTQGCVTKLSVQVQGRGLAILSRRRFTMDNRDVARS